VDWDWDKSEIPKGHTIPFIQALSTAPEGLIFRTALPTWLVSLSKRGRQALRGYNELEVGHPNTLNQQPNVKI
jgi:hypothetical protein